MADKIIPIIMVQNLQLTKEVDPPIDDQPFINSKVSIIQDSINKEFEKLIISYRLKILEELLLGCNEVYFVKNLEKIYETILLEPNEISPTENIGEILTATFVPNMPDHIKYNILQIVSYYILEAKVFLKKRKFMNTNLTVMEFIENILEDLFIYCIIFDQLALRYGINPVKHYSNYCKDDTLSWILDNNNNPIERNIILKHVAEGCDLISISAETTGYHTKIRQKCSMSIDIFNQIILETYDIEAIVDKIIDEFSVVNTLRDIENTVTDENYPEIKSERKLLFLANVVGYFTLKYNVYDYVNPKFTY